MMRCAARLAHSSCAPERAWSQAGGRRLSHWPKDCEPARRRQECQRPEICGRSVTRWMERLWSGSMAEPDRPVVCVVDDDQDIRESLRFLLEEAGYTVEEADNGLE